jgi:hypothetical protein
VQVLHRARRMLVPVRPVALARCPVLRHVPLRVVRVRPLARAMHVDVRPASTASVSHHRVHHRRDGEPVHQDHQSQARQVSSVMTVQHGGPGGEGWGGRLLAVFPRTRKAASPRKLTLLQHPEALASHTRCITLDAAH